MKTIIASTTRWLSRSPRYFRWREILENGTTIAEIAAAEKINESGPTGPLRHVSSRIFYCEIRLMRAGWMTT
jgi:hypothetical protein